jgi:hypothetical protein
MSNFSNQELSETMSVFLSSNCFYVVWRLFRKLRVFGPICIDSFMQIFNQRISPENLWVEF